MSPVEYFTWALNTTKNIADSLAVEPDVKMSRQQFNERVKERVPELNGAIHLNCNKGFVSSMYVLYQWGDKEPGNVITTKGGANSFGNCPTNFTFASK